MRATSQTLELSASDLSHFLACRHRTALDLAVAQGIRAVPSWVDPALVLLQERGLEHERRYVEQLREQGLGAIDLSVDSSEDAVARAADAMRAGVALIVQPALRNGRWFGRPDLLRRVETPSAFGPWSYEVVDTKLAKETRGGTILQLVLYSELLQAVQAAAPERFHGCMSRLRIRTRKPSRLRWPSLKRIDPFSRPPFVWNAMLSLRASARTSVLFTGSSSVASRSTRRARLRRYCWPEESRVGLQASRAHSPLDRVEVTHGRIQSPRFGTLNIHASGNATAAASADITNAFRYPPIAAWR